MNYQIEFERLMFYAEQALSGVNFKTREVLAFAPVAVLDDVVRDYKIRLKQVKPDKLKCGHDQGIEYADDSTVCVVCNETASWVETETA